MKTTRPAVILLALVLLTAATAKSDEKPAKKEISNTQIASCLFKVTTAEAVLPLNEFAIDYLLRSSGVAGRAAREILDVSPDVVSELFEIEEIFGVDSLLGGFGGGGYGGGGYGGGLGGMNLPADATPGAYGYGTTSTSRSTRPTTTAPARTPTRTPTARTPRPGTRTATPTTRTTTPTRRPPTRTPTPTRPTPRRTPTVTNPLPSTTEQTILFRLHVGLPNEAKPAAEEFMVALIDNLRSALREAFDQYSAKLNKQLKLADKEAIQVEHQLVAMQAELRAISDSRDLSRYAILRDISSLRQKLQSTNMQRASDETLYEATAKRIAETKDKRKQRADNDSITSELRLMLNVHERGLQEAQKLYDAGNASLANIQDLKEKIVRAKIELAQRREQIINPAGGVEISSLNDELATLSIQTDLAQQEMKILEVQLEEAKGLLKIADKYELLSLKADIVKQNLEETLLWRARLGRNIRSIQPPDVTVIGAE